MLLHLSVGLCFVGRYQNLFIYLVISVTSSLRLLRIQLCTLEYKPLCGHTFSFLFSTYGKITWCCIVRICLIYKKLPNCFPKQPFHNPPEHEGSVAPHPCQYLVILVGVEWNFNVVFICIFLMTEYWPFFHELIGHSDISFVILIPTVQRPYLEKPYLKHPCPQGNILSDCLNKKSKVSPNFVKYGVSTHRI